MSWIKRFLVFAGGINNPNGGWQDFKGSFDTLDEARTAVRLCRSNMAFVVSGEFWYEIVDDQDDSAGEDWKDVPIP